jgi:hypothetical protein
MRGRARSRPTARSRDSENCRTSDCGGSLRSTRACRPALARKACSATLVGLLTPRLGRLHAFSRRPHRNAVRNGFETADLGAWSQRRGRPGITPVFPVCRRRARAHPGHQSRGGNVSGAPPLSSRAFAASP